MAAGGPRGTEDGARHTPHLPCRLSPFSNRYTGWKRSWKKIWKAFSGRTIPRSKLLSALAMPVTQDCSWRKGFASDIPQVKSRIVVSGPPTWPNAKVFSLSKMIPASTNDYFVISDSDVQVSPDFLRDVIPTLLDHEDRPGDLSLSWSARRRFLVNAGGAGNVGGDALRSDGRGHAGGHSLRAGSGGGIAA